jgi:hypothetical protein
MFRNIKWLHCRTINSTTKMSDIRQQGEHKSGSTSCVIWEPQVLFITVANESPVNVLRSTALRMLQGISRQLLSISAKSGFLLLPKYKKKLN